MTVELSKQKLIASGIGNGLAEKERKRERGEGAGMGVCVCAHLRNSSNQNITCINYKQCEPQKWHNEHKAQCNRRWQGRSGQRETGDKQDERVAHIPRTSWTQRLLVNDTHPGQSVTQSRDSGTESKESEQSQSLWESRSLCRSLSWIAVHPMEYN